MGDNGQYEERYNFGYFENVSYFPTFYPPQDGKAYKRIEMSCVCNTSDKMYFWIRFSDGADQQNLLTSTDDSIVFETVHPIASIGLYDGNYAGTGRITKLLFKE